MPNTQVPNPEQAFGHTFPDNNARSVRVERFRNVSTAFSIPVGCVVIASTLTTDGTGVTKSTVIANPLTVGVAVTSATTIAAGGPVATSLAPQGSWLNVCVEGPCEVIVTTASSPGEILCSGSDTGFAGTTAGVAQTLSSAGTTAAGNLASLGRLLKASSDTNTTGQRGVVDVGISRWFQSTQP